jgi:8-oxo-dGTP pyrophosphatase MutT (NUDIX family)
MGVAASGAVDDPIPRTAARVLLIDAADRILLLRGFDPARPGWLYWMTIGGGLDPGETSAEAAARELYEETGLSSTAESLGPARWHQRIDFPFDGLWYRQEQDFFVLRVDGWEISGEVRAALLHEHVDDSRWWSVAELVDTSQRYYPDELADVLRGILES